MLNKILKICVYSFAAILMIVVALDYNPKASAAVLYAGSPYQVVHQGEVFTVDWMIDTEGESVNAIDLKLNFSKDVLQGVSASNGGSAFSVWIKNPIFQNDKGVLSFIAGVPNGVNGKNIFLLHTTFKAIKSGSAQITLDPASVLLKNDAKASKAKLKYTALNFIIAPGDLLKPVLVYSSTDPDQNSWYKGHDVVIKFDRKAGEIYSYSFSSNLEIYPEDKESAGDSVTYKNLPDGIYYFKLNSNVGPSIWRETAVFKVQIDSTPPEEFKPILVRDPKIQNGKDFVAFNAVDKTSGILHYKIKSSPLATLIVAQNSQQINRPMFGDNIKVSAVDNAGNVRTELLKYPGYISNKILAASAAAVIFLILFVFWKFKRNKK